VAVFSNEEGIRAMRKAAGRVSIYAVKPNEAGRMERTLMQRE
jgi:hypothetical protein